METENKIVMEDIKIGDRIMVTTKNGGAVVGWVVGIYEYLKDGWSQVKYYKIGIGGKNYVDILEEDIAEVTNYFEDNIEFVNTFIEKYDIDLLESDGKKRKVSDVVNEVLVKGIWDKMNDNEKTELTKWLTMDVATQVDLISALDMSRERNNELHQEVMKHLDDRIKLKRMVMDFKENWDEKTNQIPECFRWAYDVIYKYFGIEDLINAI